MTDPLIPKIAPPPLRDIYLHECSQCGCKPNTGVLKLLMHPGTEDEVERHVDPEDDLGLTEIDLSTNIVGHHGVHPVFVVAQHARRLRALNLRDNYLSNENVKELCRLLENHPSLSSLDVSSNPISHLGGKQLSQLASKNPKLREIIVNDTIINPALVKIIQEKCSKNQKNYVASGEEEREEKQREVEKKAAVSFKETDQQAASSIEMSLSSTGRGRVPRSSSPSGSDEESFKFLSVVADKLRDNEQQQTEFPAMTYLMHAAKVEGFGSALLCPEDSAFQFLTPINDSDQLRLPHLQVLQSIEYSKEYEGVQILCTAAFGGATKLFPTLQVARQLIGLHKEFRREKFLATRVLLSAAFGGTEDGAENYLRSENVTPRRGANSPTTPLLVIRYPEHPMMLRSNSTLVRPVNEIPLARAKYMSLFVMRQAGIDSIRHSALYVLLQVVCNEPVEMLEKANVQEQAFPNIVDHHMSPHQTKKAATGGKSGVTRFYALECLAQSLGHEDSEVGPTSSGSSLSTTAVCCPCLHLLCKVVGISLPQHLNTPLTKPILRCSGRRTSASEESSEETKKGMSGGTQPVNEGVPWSALNAVFAAGNEQQIEEKEKGLESLEKIARHAQQDGKKQN